MCHIKASHFDSDHRIRWQCFFVTGCQPDVMIQLGLNGWWQPPFRSGRIKAVCLFLPVGCMLVILYRLLYIESLCSWMKLWMAIAYITISSAAAILLSLVMVLLYCLLHFLQYFTVFLQQELCISNASSLSYKKCNKINTFATACFIRSAKAKKSAIRVLISDNAFFYTIFYQIHSSYCPKPVKFS